MNSQMEKKWLIGGIGLVAVVAVIGLALVLVSGGSGKSARSEAELHQLAREGQEAEEEAFGGRTNPSEPRNLEEAVIAHPRNEEATARQLEQQILANEESSDPTHEQKAWCGYASSYSHYVSYNCQGYSVGSSSVLGQIEVTVNTNTGEVLVEEE